MFKIRKEVEKEGRFRHSLRLYLMMELCEDIQDHDIRSDLMNALKIQD